MEVEEIGREVMIKINCDVEDAIENLEKLIEKFKEIKVIKEKIQNGE